VEHLFGAGLAAAAFVFRQLRKYFWARISQATWLQPAGTSISSALKTTEPSGLRISLEVTRYSIDS
jgi:hypothetical protein